MKSQSTLLRQQGIVLYRTKRCNDWFFSVVFWRASLQISKLLRCNWVNNFAKSLYHNTSGGISLWFFQWLDKVISPKELFFLPRQLDFGLQTKQNTNLTFQFILNHYWVSLNKHIGAVDESHSSVVVSQRLLNTKRATQVVVFIVYLTVVWVFDRWFPSPDFIRHYCRIDRLKSTNKTKHKTPLSTHLDQPNSFHFPSWWLIDLSEDWTPISPHNSWFSWTIIVQFQCGGSPLPPEISLKWRTYFVRQNFFIRRMP